MLYQENQQLLRETFGKAIEYWRHVFIMKTAMLLVGFVTEPF